MVGAHLTLEFAESIIWVRGTEISSFTSHAKGTTPVHSNHGWSNVGVLIVFDNLRADTAKYRDGAIRGSKVNPKIDGRSCHNYCCPSAGVAITTSPRWTRCSPHKTDGRIVSMTTSRSIPACGCAATTLIAWP